MHRSLNHLLGKTVQRTSWYYGQTYGQSKSNSPAKQTYHVSSLKFSSPSIAASPLKMRHVESRTNSANLCSCDRKKHIMTLMAVEVPQLRAEDAEDAADARRRPKTPKTPEDAADARRRRRRPKMPEDAEDARRRRRGPKTPEDAEDAGRRRRRPKTPKTPEDAEDARRRRRRRRRPKMQQGSEQEFRN